MGLFRTTDPAESPIPDGLAASLHKVAPAVVGVAAIVVSFGAKMLRESNESLTEHIRHLEEAHAEELEKAWDAHTAAVKEAYLAGRADEHTGARNPYLDEPVDQAPDAEAAAAHDVTATQP